MLFAFHAIYELYTVIICTSLPYISRCYLICTCSRSSNMVFTCMCTLFVDVFIVPPYRYSSTNPGHHDAENGGGRAPDGMVVDTCGILKRDVFEWETWKVS